MNEFATFDYRRFPRYLQVIFHGAPADSAAFQEYINGLEHMYTHKEPFSLLFDASQLSLKIAPEYMVQQALYMKQSEPQAKAYLKKVAIVISSQLVRNLIHCLFQIHKPVSDTEIFTDKKSALRWLFNLDS
jgi:hypothetical protein